MQTRMGIFIGLFSLTFIHGAFSTPWNNPHSENAAANIRYGAFVSSPKTLDPARAYNADETLFIAQIYEPILQYAYLIRPFTLVPLTATQLPVATYYDAKNHLIASQEPKKIAYTVYDIQIQPHIFYAPHPAFVKNASGYIYHHLSEQQLKSLHTLQDFQKTATRELVAQDYVYEIKRLASPRVNSPIFGLMCEHIIGMRNYSNTLSALPKSTFLDLRQFPLEGAKVISRYHYQIKISGFYPQFSYWLAMPFFAPIPWEADAFYSQPGLEKKNISFNWYPVGTGPYQLTVNNPNSKMVLTKNPNFHAEYYPQGKGEVDAGKRLPFIDQFVFDLDKESIPRWNKFLQGYYDKSTISNDSFDQAITLNHAGKPILTKLLIDKDIQLQTSVSPSIFYMGFNMLDETVGGYSAKNRALRQAIGIAINNEEYLEIFMNGRGQIAQGIIPPGIFGYEKGEVGLDHAIYDWKNGQAQRKSINVAKALLIQAGYPNGINPRTHQPLELNYDAVSSGNPNDQAYFSWLQKQFSKLGIQLNIRQSEFNRFQDKVRTGNVQIFSWGWQADYPDPENFLFLLYGKNSRVKYNGENATNYDNPIANQLYEAIRNLPNGTERQALIHQFVQLVQTDSPWICAYFPVDFILSQSWNSLRKPHGMANNLLKYEKINPSLRAKKIALWNKPIIWPVIVLFSGVFLLLLPLCIIYWKKDHEPTIKRKK